MFEHRYPSALLKERERVAASGSFREKVRYDLIARPHYAFGMLAAADVARFCGVQKLLAIECGVAEGQGLLNLCELAKLVAQETGVTFELYGFDTGSGLPPLEDYRDHPEIWTEGDFGNPNREELLKKLPDNAHMIWGDVKETVPAFLKKVTKEMPIGFVSLDVDLYSSTRDALALFLGEPEQCLPVTLAYFDDTHGAPQRIGSLFRNRWAGQLRAIDEFNENFEMRKIDTIRTLPHRRPLNQELWLEQAFAVHMLDHPLRQPGRMREALRMNAHGAHDRMEWPL